MVELFRAVTLAEACRLLNEAWHQRPVNNEMVKIESALGRRLSRPLVAAEDVPGFPRSTVDGIAVRAADTFGASESLPAYLEIVGEIMVGEEALPLPAAGKAIRIATGAMLPPGADAVVMVEYTEPLDETTIGIVRPVGPGENVIQAGEDLKKGQLVFAAGHRLRPPDLGFLATLGCSEVEVESTCRVGIISTGDELVEVGQHPAQGQIRDANSYTLLGLVQEAGGKPKRYGIVPDDFTALQRVLSRALEQEDLLLISGGSSVGIRDITFAVLESLAPGGVMFHGIAIKPGKPTLAAIVGGKPVIGLPGHPASAIIAFQVLVKPLLQPELQKRCIFARLTRNLASAAGRDDFVRVRLKRQEGEWLAEPLLGKSGLLSTLVDADGLLHIPAAKQGLMAGDLVEILMI